MLELKFYSSPVFESNKDKEDTMNYGKDFGGTRENSYAFKSYLSEIIWRCLMAEAMDRPWVYLMAAAIK